VVTTSSSPADVVALTLSEFSKIVMTGAVVSVVTVVVVDAHMDVADRQTVRVEHLQYQQAYKAHTLLCCTYNTTLCSAVNAEVIRTTQNASLIFRQANDLAIRWR